MPELPEVETIKREFEREVLGFSITFVEIRSPNVIDVPPGQFKERVERASFKKVTRRAKYLVINLSSGYTLVIHLKISGQLLHVSAASPVDEYTHVIFGLDDGTQLRLRDVNSFALIRLLKTTDVLQFFAQRKIGPEPLKPDFSYEAFRTILKRHPRARVKPLLIDQHVVAGIGSIYADEILYYARVHPAKSVGSLTEDEIHRIYDGIKQILPEAISHRGTSTQFYIDLRGQKGEHQNYLKVHAQTGKPCGECPGVVEKIEISGRGTYLCPSCQH